MPETTRVIAGDCTLVYDDSDRTEHRGRVVVLVKPDNTVLVHDADGYQPVAWLTRAASLSWHPTDDVALLARDGDATLRVSVHDEYGAGRYWTSAAGTPLADCPDCAGTLVQGTGAVTCIACEARYGLPSGATVRDERCDCGLPRVRVERGLAFDVCLDRSCQPLDDAVREAFDRKWACPDCDGRLAVRRRGGLIAGCENYPDCETGFSFPTGVVTDDCACGLPRFETATGERCLDARCTTTPS